MHGDGRNSFRGGICCYGLRSVLACLGDQGDQCQGPDACHAEFGIGRLKQQTTSVTAPTRRALCVETDEQMCFLDSSLAVALLYRYRELLRLRVRCFRVRAAAAELSGQLQS